MNATTKNKAKSTAVKMLIALVAAVGLAKVSEMLSAKGGMMEKVAAFGTLLAGAGLQFSKSEIAQTVGIVAMGQGGVNSIKALITSNGAVKSDAISSTLAKAVLPQGAGLSGTRRGMRGLGNTPSFTLPVGAPSMAMPSPLSRTLST